MFPVEDVLSLKSLDGILNQDSDEFFEVNNRHAAEYSVMSPIRD